ncbi:MAG: porphobilinogen synthase [Actinobacteria bacterium HGW-Actinobacteria-7]|jgi:porphobilinogen synthase|nr:MAG: porphobilinogen synthase [Actinobacteria bacterium HGW-Actinobacteria-7]
MQFPSYRPRRLRANSTIRSMVRETAVSSADLIFPLFVKPGTGLRDEIMSMPGQFQLSLDQLPAEIDELKALGVPAVILFGLPSTKDEVGSEAYDEHGIIQEAIRTIKAHDPEFYVITDVCMCEYTSHGHCGIIDERGCVINDVTIELLAKEAVSHAEAGADMVAPSDMMDGRVAAIRAGLDAEGFQDIPIMAYSVKYASGYYGPFRDAADSTPTFGDRSQYQMDPANAEEGLREAALDIAEGADIVMVKPALAYMDMIRRVKDEFGYPTAAYNVSGEYAMVKAAAANDWIDEKRVVLETLLGFKRAGADLIITYHAKDAARWLKGE